MEDPGLNLVTILYNVRMLPGQPSFTARMRM
jgi:hypothetical protein